ncbi:hypothetical protein ASD75_00480 [Acidovorax sp. Root568]|nr:hypothetical protein ASD75_00480 [Acidovorax sp. Root568]
MHIWILKFREPINYSKTIKIFRGSTFRSDLANRWDENYRMLWKTRDQHLPKLACPVASTSALPLGNRLPEH